MKRTIISTGTGQSIPVTKELNIKPLTLMGKVIHNGNGDVVMDDQWIYINWPHYGLQSMNVNRAQYCQMIYQSEISILESIGFAKTTKNLDRFIALVSDKLIFNKKGITFQVFLKKTKKGFDLSHIKPYWLLTHSPNIPSYAIPERYKEILYLPSSATSSWAHNLVVDLEKAFNFKSI